MKIKIILLISLALFGCKDNHTPNIAVENSYLIHAGIDLAPYSIPIKEQSIKGDNPVTLTANTDGLIESMTLDYYKFVIDYKNGKYAYETEDKNLNLDIKFDQAKNTLSYQDAKKNNKLLVDYDSKGRVIKIEDSIHDLDLISQVDYENDLVSKRVIEIGQKYNENGSFIVVLREYKYFYNDKKQLSKRIQYDYKIELGKIVLDENNQRIAEMKEECSYGDYNQHGDWTKEYCLGPNKVTTHFYLRTLEYF